MRVAAIIVGILLWATPTQPQILQFSGSVNNFVGPLDVISGAIACWSLRACSIAKAGTKVANICNSGDANCADVNSLPSGNFDVASAQGSPLNCGGSGGTCTVQTLYDQTGNGNDVGNATAARRSTLVFSCLGSLPCMAYSGTQALGAGTFSSSSAQPYSMSAVTERTGTFTTQGTFMAFFGNGVQFLYGGSTNTVAIYAGNGVPTATAADSAFHAVQGMWNGGSSKINVDGTNTNVDLLAGGTNALTFPTCLGSDSGVACSAANPLTGRIAEALIWAGDQSASFTALCHNQFAYWGTSVSC